MKTLSICALLPLATAVSGALWAAEAKDDKSGYKVEFGGSYLQDFVRLNDYAAQGGDDQRWLRRRGTLEASLSHGDFTFVAEGGYSNGDTFEWRDAYIDYDMPKSWDLKLGLMKPVFGLSWTSSLKNLLTMERTIGEDLLAIRRSPGAQLSYSPGHHLFQLGAYEETVDDERLVKLANFRYVYENEFGAANWHLAFSAAHEDYDGAKYRVSTRAETTVMDNFLRTDKIKAERVDTTGFDFSWQQGRLTLMGEALANEVISPKDGNRRYQGGYLQAAWLLSGDAHAIKGGELKRLKPQGQFASELVVSASMLDAAYGRNSGFEAVTQSVGLNFYYGDHLKLMLQANRLHVLHQFDDADGNAVMARFQLRF